MPGNNLQANPGPLKPTVLPERPWQHIDMDFWGPLPSGEHILIVIDEYSCYPEIEFVSSTGAKAVIPHIDKIFATHGFPEQVKTDGGPPFSGSENQEYQQYMKWAGIKAIQVSPDDPETNGLTENFMKVLQKIWYISKIEGKNPRQEIYKYLWQYRATPLAQLEDHLQKCSSDESTTQGCRNSKSQHMTPSSGIKTLHPKPSKNTIRTTKVMYAHTTSQQVTKCSSWRNQPKATPGTTQTPTQ